MSNKSHYNSEHTAMNQLKKNEVYIVQQLQELLRHKQFMVSLFKTLTFSHKPSYHSIKNVHQQE